MAASPDSCKQRHIRFHHLSTANMSHAQSHTCNAYLEQAAYSIWL